MEADTYEEGAWVAPWEPLRDDDPTECGGFRLTHRLGHGGFGTVYLGFRPDIPAPAAVKIFRPEHAAVDTWRQRFRREIEMIKAMAGVHTAALFDADGDGDPAWLATQYVHAPSLDRLTRQYGAFGVLPAWWLATGLGEALAEIHAKGILHRDLKPQNILVEPTGVKVIDFGISRFSAGSNITVESSFFGTNQYCANEHLLDPRDATEKSDVFALGVVLVWVTTGHTPFEGIAASERLAGALPNLDAVPDALYDLVESCLASNPAHRPTAMTVFRTALGHLMDFAVPLASEAGLPLPREIRTFVEDWAAQPIPAPEDALAVTGSSQASTDSSGSSGGARMPSGGEGPDGAGPAAAPQPRAARSGEFDEKWVARWHDAANRRRDGYGR